MCGITGHYHFNRNTQIDSTNLENSLNSLKKRGPDCQKIETFPGIGLGHSRLSIIDLNSESNQPMRDSSGRYSIIFNGEIFNFKDLKNELGIHFKTNSDTEVLVCAYIKWQEKCLEKLNGFFSFVIYDHETHSLFAARDRLGIKPFLYSLQNNSFYFASELKALLEYPIPRDLSKNTLNAFFQLSYIPGEQGVLRDVKRLLPGHYITVKNQKVSVMSYYSLKGQKQSGQKSVSLNEAKETLSHLVDSAADYWIESDAALGSFLSGGIDSSIVVAITSKKMKNLKTFSVTFPESQFHNEGPYALAVAKKYQTDHTEIPLVTENLYSVIDQVLDYIDEPFADSSAIPTFALCQQVSKSVRVALSGDGADELFGGYEKHGAETVAHKLRSMRQPARAISSLLKNLPESRDQAFGNKIRQFKKFFTGLAQNEQERYLQWCSFNDSSTIDSLLMPEHRTNAWVDELPFESKAEFSGLNRTLYRDVQMVLPNDMLTKVDLMSMANSLEVRPLFLDHRIVDYIFSLPDQFKIRNGQKKYLLLETFKHLLPAEVYNRPKHGFTVQLMPFFRKNFWEKLNDVYLNDKFIQTQGLFNIDFIRNLKVQIQNEKGNDLQALVWGLVTFQNFWLKYKVRY